MSTLTRFREGMAGPFDLTAWPWLALPGNGIRIEEMLDGDRYTVRAEMPGVDPAKDIEVTLTDDALKIQVERTETHTGRTHTEFHYGTFCRTIPMPAGLRKDTVTAAYEDGILRITAVIGEHEAAGKNIPIKVAPTPDA